MKKIKLLCSFLLFYLISLNISSQKRLDKCVDLDLLAIIDTASFKIIDSVIFTKKQNLYQGDYTLNIIVKKDPNLDVYLLGIYLFPYGNIIKESDYWGISYMNGHSLLVEGCKVDGLFIKMTEKKRFNYYIYENNIVVPGEYPSWFFLYSSKSIKYLDLPEWLVRRLGFEYCE
jgi:hypothetical protein